MPRTCQTGWGRAPLALVGLATLLLALGGCGEPRYPIMRDDLARQDERPMQVKVLRVIDALTVPGISSCSHFIEVEVLDGPDPYRGQRLTMLYDEFLRGAKPPKEGTTETTTPAQWLSPAKGGKGRPFHGFDK